MRSSVSPIALLTAGLVDIAPWFPQCWTVSPIQAPANPAVAEEGLNDPLHSASGMVYDMHMGCTAEAGEFHGSLVNM